MLSIYICLFSLQNSAMGGFFKCLIEGYERGHDAQSSLPTVDVEGQNISPLSEYVCFLGPAQLITIESESHHG